jgi:type III restriction enzyme
MIALGYYARRIAQDVKLPSQFSALAPKVREFLETKAFGGPVTLNEPAMIKAISSNVAQYVTVKTFVEALRKMVIAELEPQLLHPGRPLSETPPFPWSRATFAADKCIFNLVPCHNEFEKEFAQFLQKAPDVQRFAKLPEQFGFAIEYDSVGNFGTTSRTSSCLPPTAFTISSRRRAWRIPTSPTRIARRNFGARTRRDWQARHGHI